MSKLKNILALFAFFCIFHGRSNGQSFAQHCSSKTRVAVIGAGAGGLIASRQILSKPEQFSVTIFEQTDNVGGTWVYTNESIVDQYGLPIHSSMYKNLRTNIPKEIMALPDYPFEDESLPSFLSHKYIHQYLYNYSVEFNVYPNVKFHSFVKSVKPKTLNDGQIKWCITYEDLKKRKNYIRTFDVVVVANGHYTVGDVPKIPGLETFKGVKIHSHQYRWPEDFAGKNVCVLGAGYSGMDIAVQTSKFAKKVYLSHNQPKPVVLGHSRVTQTKGVSSVNGSTFTFRDGMTAECDVFIYATGCQYSFPFLSAAVSPSTKDKHVEPLYKHIVHMDLPNLFFIGVPGNIIAFPTFQAQAQYVVALLTGVAKLPSSEQMHKEWKAEKTKLLAKGIPVRHLGWTEDKQAYVDELAALANVKPPRPAIFKIFDEVQQLREKYFHVFREFNFKIIDDENYERYYKKLHPKCHLFI